MECLYQNTSFLEVHCLPGVLIPGEKREVEFVFYPREAKHYHEVIPFEINGLSTMLVDIRGEGTDMKVSYNICLWVFTKFKTTKQLLKNPFGLVQCHVQFDK
mgnify:CR=1 FL=1